MKCVEFLTFGCWKFADKLRGYDQEILEESASHRLLRKAWWDGVKVDMKSCGLYREDAYISNRWRMV